MNKNKNRFVSRDDKSNKIIFSFKANKEDRLLDFCYSKLGSKSRGEVKSFLKHGCICINNCPTTQFDFMLSKGDVINIYKRSIKSAKDTNSILKIIYEDEDFLVIDKPAKLLSVASDKNHFQNAYTYACSYIAKKDKKAKLYVIHRIDEDTSGVLIFCKNEKLKNILTKDWNSFVVKRKYIGICEGNLSKKQDTLINYIKENNLNLMYVTDDVLNGKKCITKYKVLKENKSFSLLDIEIETGRKNQIRVQLGHIGHHIIGDDKYGEPKNPLKRLGLHANELHLINPLTKKKMVFKAPVPQIFFDLFKN